MFEEIRNKYSELSPEAKRGFWAGVVITLAMLAFFGAVLPEFIDSQNYEEFAANGAPLFLSVLTGFSTWLFWKDRPRMGGWMLILSVLVVMILVPILAEGVGFIIAIFAFGVATFVSGLTLPPKDIPRANMLAVISSVAIILLDLFWPAERIRVDSQDIRAATIASAVVIILYFVLIIRQYSTYTLRTKLVIALVTVVIIVGSSIAFFFNRSTTSFHAETVGASLKSLSATKSLAIGDLIEHQLNNLTVLSLNRQIQDQTTNYLLRYPSSVNGKEMQIANFSERWRNAIKSDDIDDPIVKERLGNPISLELREYKSNFQDNLEMIVVDKYGALIATTSLVDTYNFSGENWFLTAYKDSEGWTYISEPELVSSISATAIIIAIPIRNQESGVVVGVIRTAISLRPFERLLSATNLGETGEADMIFPGDAYRTVHDGIIEDVDSGTIEAIQKVDNEDFAEVEYEETESIVSGTLVETSTGNKLIENLGWLVVLHQDLQEANAPIELQTQTSLVIVLVTIGLASLGAIILAQLLSRPIVQLTGVAEQVAAGDLDARADVVSRDEIGMLAETFNTMTDTLRDTLSGLERRVADRTRAIELSADISRRLSTIMDPSDLVSEVVVLLQSTFGYYHVHIYLFDGEHEYLEMVGGTGEAGQTMLEQKHKIEIGKGLVGQAGATGIEVLVADTTMDPSWIPNPLLPNTKSEIAVPILLGEDVIGALDVQQNMVDGLREEDADLLRGIANQVAIALQNAQQYSDAENRAKQEALVSEIVQKIQNTQKVENALQVAVRELGRNLGFDKTRIRIGFGSDDSGQDGKLGSRELN